MGRMAVVARKQQGIIGEKRSKKVNREETKKRTEEVDRRREKRGEERTWVATHFHTSNTINIP